MINWKRHGHIPGFSRALHCEGQLGEGTGGCGSEASKEKTRGWDQGAMQRQRVRMRPWFPIG